MEDERLVTFRTIGTDLALQMQEAAVAAAMNVSGFVVVFSRTGMQECSRAVGRYAKPLNVRVALAKIETVLVRRQSTSVWRRMVEEERIRPEDYAGAIETLFCGGLAIFADDKCREFVGAIAFSGGEE